MFRPNVARREALVIAAEGPDIEQRAGLQVRIVARIVPAANIRPRLESSRAAMPAGPHAEAVLRVGVGPGPAHHAGIARDPARLDGAGGALRARGGLAAAREPRHARHHAAARGRRPVRQLRVRLGLLPRQLGQQLRLGVHAFGDRLGRLRDIAESCAV